MSSEEDDFFGFKKIDAIPFPDAFRRRNYSGSNTNKSTDDDFLESAFFPELLHDEKNKQKIQPKVAKNEIDFFDENFFGEANASSPIPPPGEIKKLGGKSEYVRELERQLTGRQQIWDLIDPVWKCTPEELVDLMAKRVIYETDDIIAFDKPYQMAYSSAPENQAQLDRILQSLKKRVAPNIDRFHIINSLDKSCTGVILFAKNKEQQIKVKKLIDEDHALFRYRCLCKNNPVESKARISIPLIKVLRGSNFKLCPLIGTAKRNRMLYHFDTDYKLVNENKSAHLSLIDAFTKRNMPHLVRSHLFYGINCSIVGDMKYVRPALKVPSIGKNPHPTMISPFAMQLLEIRKNDVRKLPMFMHLAEVHVPESSGGQFSVVKAETPAFFVHALKKLQMLIR